MTPQQDTYPHWNCITCPCGPTEDGWLIVHQAWDRREYAEGEWFLDKVPFVSRVEVM